MQGKALWCGRGRDTSFFAKGLEDRSGYIVMVQNFEHDNEILQNLILAFWEPGLPAWYCLCREFILGVEMP